MPHTPFKGFRAAWVRVTISLVPKIGSGVKELVYMQTPDRKLLWHGAFLFLLGLLTGLLETRFANIRMALSAHLEGVMNGTFVLVLGAIWGNVRLSRAAKTTAFATLLYAAYGNWLITTLAAIFGTAANTPIASAGHSGQPWQESLIATGFLSVAISMIACVLLVLWGLSGREKLESWNEAAPRISGTAEGLNK
jgi:hydroxylaminobenzene mutase